MKRTLLFVLLAVGLASAYNTPDNWAGYLDTASITSFNADSLRYSTAFPLTDGEDVRVLIKVDDTASAGFGADSLKFAWGYQLGTITLDTANTRDTLWSLEDKITIDTVDTDSLGVGSLGYCGEDGDLTRYWNRATDTLSIPGWAVQNRWFVPEWAELIRFWAKGQTKNKVGAFLKVKVEMHQRQYVPTRKP